MTSTPNLDRLVALVSDKGGTSYPKTADDDSLTDEDMESAHQHLRKECPWYEKASAGAPVADFKQHCQHAEGEGQPPRLVVKLTPHTAEASTVDKPTVPPGGPGLFHVKGLHLPPYIQHLWFHLVKEYGEKKAYGVAVGVVKKWAAGINPGGKHPTKTHPDVRAAAGKNVAEWEADRVKAHAQSAKTRSREHVKATVELASAQPDGFTEDSDFPGAKQLPLPPVPDEKTARAMYSAHRIDGTLYHLAHAAERLMEARKNKTLRGYHMIHVNNHLSFALSSGHQLVDNLRKNYPAEGQELDALTKTIGLARALSPGTKAATFAHLLETVLYDEAHAKRHTLLMLKPGSDAEWEFNFDHARKHMKGAEEHCYKLVHHVEDNYPDIAKWFGILAKAEDPNDPFTGLTSQGLYVRLEGSGGGGLGGGSVVTAPGAMRDFIPPPTGGKYSEYGLHQKPSQTVSPSPPLPPMVQEPTPDEVRKLIPGVPESYDVSLSNSVKKFLETAAVKLEKGDELGALAMLRSALTAVFAAHKADIGTVMPAFYTAGVFSRIPPAEQSSAGQAILEAQKQRDQWRELNFAIQVLADRIRKRYFHGEYNGPSMQARLADETDVTELEKVLALAGQAAPAVSYVTKLVEEVALATAAGKTAGHSVGASPKVKKPDAHQMHVAHLEHLHHEHVEHTAHVAHEHVEHLRHMAHLAHVGVTGATPAIRQNALLAEGEAAPVTPG